MKKVLSIVVVLITSSLYTMDQDKQTRVSPPEPTAKAIEKRRSSSSPFHPVTRTIAQSFETQDLMREESAGKIFDDKRGRSTDKK